MARIKYTLLVPDGESFLSLYPDGTYLDTRSKTQFRLSELEGGTDYIMAEGRGFTYKRGDVTGGTITSISFKDANGADYLTIDKLKLKIDTPFSGDHPFFFYEKLFVEDDKVTGSRESDMILSGAGKNTVSCLNGNDIFVSMGNGIDTVSGDLGSDTFMFEGEGTPTSKMVVTDFDAVGGGLAQDYLYYDTLLVEDVFKSGADTKIAFFDGGLIVLRGVDRGDFTMDDIQYPL